MNLRLTLVIGNLLLASAAAAQPLRPEASAPAAASASSVYRCQALDGSTLFQDRPCNQSAATREAQQGREGTRINADAPPPAEDGAAVAGRYQRYLDQLAAQRRLDAEADTAQAARLKAEAELEAARQVRAEPDHHHEADHEADRWLPVYLPYRGWPIHRPPVVEPPAPPPPPGPRPTRPPPREPRDVRAEILDTRR